MKKVIVFLADGFEEVEALTPVDILRRAGVSVTVVGVGNDVITGARGVKVLPDTDISQMDITDCDMIVLPGGFPGFENLANCKAVMDAVEYMTKEGRFVTAICGAPAVVLGKNGFLSDKRAVCYPGMEADLNCKEISAENVCIDGNFITSKSAATAMEFAFALTQALCGKQKADEVKKGIVYDAE
ncbi:MAG: DJ-1/PfpI family protein [Clostridia bacterium]|nr:DJ-1/PfpI family protein [Clostridia bacterium]